jgi:hypothetical protein
MIARQIDGDADQPRAHTRLAAEAGPLLIGADEAILGQVVGQIGIAHQPQQHAIDAPLVLAHDQIKIQGWAFCHPCFQRRKIQRVLHMKAATQYDAGGEEWFTNPRAPAVWRTKD